MSFTNIFGGSAVNPAQPSYLALDLDADTALVWPLETTAGEPVVAAMIDVTPATTGLSLAMPAADTGSSGVATMISNVGTDTFTLTDSEGNEIVEIATTESWLIALTDNSTAAGEWRALQMASTTSSGVAAALAGDGLQASAGKLRTWWETALVAADQFINTAFRAKLMVWTGATGTFQFDTLSNLGLGYYVGIYNGGTDDLDLTTSGGQTINGATTVTLSPNESCIVIAGALSFYATGILIGTLPITEGGTGASTAGAALTNLGGTSLGIGLFTAPTAASARSLLGIVNYTLQETTVSTNQAVTSSNANTIYVATAAIGATLPLSTGLSNQFIVGFYAQGGAITVTPQATESINGQTAGATYTFPLGSSGLLLTDANGAWWPVFVSFQASATWVAAGGSANAITATYSPPVSSLDNGMLLGFRAAAPNSSASPTFAPNGLTARTIYKEGAQALTPGDIPGANAEVLLRYNSSTPGWELLNPATASPTWGTAAGTADAIAVTVAAASGGLYDGLLVAFKALGANTVVAPTLNVNSLGAVTITKGGASPLVPGDIPAANAECICRYDSGLAGFVLMNPATPSQNWAAAAGTATALTLTVDAANGGVYDGLLVGFRASLANTTAAPTLAVNGGTARTIVRQGDVALVVGDILANGEYLARYNLANTRWELLNPSVGMQTGNMFLKTGTGTITLGSGSVTYASAFPTATDSVVLTISGGAGTGSLHPVFVGATTAAGFAAWGDAGETLQFNYLAWGH